MNEVTRLLTLLIFISSTLAEDKVSFNYEVRPILSDKCFHCHGPDPENREKKLRLDIPEGAYKALKKGMYPIKPGDLKHSAVYARIITDDEDDMMHPPDSNLELSEKEKLTIKKWIEQGLSIKNPGPYKPIPKK